MLGELMSQTLPQRLACNEIVQAAVRLQQGDVSALELVLRTLGPRVAAGLQKRHPALGLEDIEDVLSAASHRLWLARDQYDPSRGSLAAWFFIIADNLARDLIRKETRLPLQGLEADQVAGVPDKKPGDEETANPGPIKQMLEDILESLSPVDRCIITGFAQAGGEGPWASNLAGELGLRAGTIRVRCQRIKARIRKQLQAAGLAAPM
jgi:RNA polymerase sigma factor (sigma-70 family)